jgi:hypothetical protein
MIKSSNQYSYFAKRLQFAALLIGSLIFLFAAFNLDAHVELHLHRSPETDALEKAAQEKKEYDEYIKSECLEKEGGWDYFYNQMVKKK